MPITPEELMNRFTYHPPLPGQIEIYQILRDQAHAFARMIVALTPESREQSLAITALEEAVSWSNAAIARHGTTPGQLALDQAVKAYQEQGNSSPTAAEISEALDFHCTPPLTIRPEDEHDWNIVKQHISAMTTPALGRDPHEAAAEHARKIEELRYRPEGE